MGSAARSASRRRAATPQDALIAISFKTYNPDTVRLFPELVARGVPAVVITDSLLSPIVEGADVVFEIPDMPEAALRTMVAPMCLAQSLAVGLTLALDGDQPQADLACWPRLPSRPSPTCAPTAVAKSGGNSLPSGQSQHRPTLPNRLSPPLGKPPRMFYMSGPRPAGVHLAALQRNEPGPAIEIKTDWGIV